MMTVDLPYGAEQSFHWTLDNSCQATLLTGPRHDVDIAEKARERLEQPLGLPAMGMAVVPGDRVTIALERHVPPLRHVVSALWCMLAGHGVAPEDVLLLQPADPWQTSRIDPRDDLPESIRDRVRWKIHDPTLEENCGYLASSAGGERVYLARELLESDLVIPVSLAGFDPILGYKSPSGVLYPGLSNLEAFKRTQGLGHQELQPQDERPLCQLIDEIGWLLGVQYYAQVVPSARRGRAADVLIGSLEAVSLASRNSLDAAWRVSLPERVETVIVALPTDQQSANWFQLGTALAAARALVEKGGKIIVLSDLSAEPGTGVKLLSEQRSPRAALQPLRALGCEDFLPATQLASAADWAQVYLLSRLDSGLVEALHCTPVESEAELSRVLDGIERCAVLSAGQYTHGEIGAKSSG